MRRELTPLVLLLSCLAVLGCFLPNFQLLAVNQHLVLAANVLALNFCLGLGGQASMATAAYCGFGAYSSVLLHAFWPEGTVVILPVIILASFGLGCVVSYPMEKLGEGFLAMATLCVCLIFTNLVLTFTPITGGSNGMMVAFHPYFPGLGELKGDRANFFALLGLLAIGGYVFAALRDSRLGRALLACKDDTLAASSCGVDRLKVRALSFGLGGAVAAMAGVIQANSTGFISPGQFDLALSLKTLLFLVIGGPGRLVRPLLAVLVLESLISRFHALGDANVLFHGLILAAALLVGHWREAGLLRWVPSIGCGRSR